MTQMFCTLKQAADKLKTTETEIEAMLNDGILREFRDGSSRLLKVADLTGLVVAANAAASERCPARARRKAGSMPPKHGRQASELFDMEIKLPPAPAAPASSSCAVAPRRPPRRSQPSTGPKRIPRTIVQKPVVAPRRQSRPRAVVISPESSPQPPRPQTCEMSLRQWIWTGLIDDSPLAIFIVFGTVLLGVCALAGAAYLLLQIL